MGGLVQSFFHILIILMPFECVPILSKEESYFHIIKSKLYTFTLIKVESILSHHLRRMKNNAHAPITGAMAMDIKDIW